MNNHELLTNLIAEYTRYVDSREGRELTEQGFLNFYGTTLQNAELSAPELQETEIPDFEGTTEALANL